MRRRSQQQAEGKTEILHHQEIRRRVDQGVNHPGRYSNVLTELEGVIRDKTRLQILKDEDEHEGGPEDQNRDEEEDSGRVIRSDFTPSSLTSIF